jgi:hypothetical protein
MKTKPSRMTNRIHNLTIAIISIQAGCASIVIIIIALVLGAWLGSLLGQRGLCIFGMVILSVPVSLYVMLWIAMRAVNFHLRAKSVDDETTN